MPVGCAPTRKLVEEMFGAICELVTEAVLVNPGDTTFRISGVLGSPDEARRTDIFANDTLGGDCKSSTGVVPTTKSLCVVAGGALSIFALEAAWG